jgi:hypothetical protein
MPLANGQVFAGYRILRLLGSGGMGEVYLAQHPRLPRRDALKILPVEMSSNVEYRVRFGREADLASTLYHPHIVGIHDRGEFDGHSNPAVVIGCHLNATPPTLVESRPELAALDPVLAIALSKSPGDRFPHCADFARALALARAKAVTRKPRGQAATPPAARTKAAAVKPGARIPGVAATPPPARSPAAEAPKVSRSPVRDSAQSAPPVRRPKKRRPKHERPRQRTRPTGRSRRHSYAKSTNRARALIRNRRSRHISVWIAAQRSKSLPSRLSS